MRQAACGENHTVFLMNSGCVLTCGSNEFGQLGLQQDAAAGEGATGQGGLGRFNTPTLIEKTILDSVVFVAAGRFHTMAVRKQTEGDALKAMAVDTTILGLDAERAKEMPFIASMGIYVFSAKAMESLLDEHFPESHDFGGEIIPSAKDMGMQVQAFLYDG